MTSVYFSIGSKNIKDYLYNLEYATNHDENFYIELEKEIQKYINSNFICAKLEYMYIIDSSSHIKVYFLNEYGSIFHLFLKQTNLGFTIWGNNFFDTTIIKSWTKDFILKSNFEGKESYKIKKDDSIVSIFKNCSFNYNNNNDKNVMQSFILLCENFIEKENQLLNSSIIIEEQNKKIKFLESSIKTDSIKNNMYIDAITSNLKREKDEEIRIIYLDEKENILRLTAYYEAVISSIKREKDEELKIKSELLENKFFNKSIVSLNYLKKIPFIGEKMSYIINYFLKK